MNTEPNEPINGDAHCPNPKFNYFSHGLTKREYFSAMALQGIIAAHNIYETGIDNEVNSKTAVNAADALIDALNQPSPPKP
jgi:hypothetical protein